MRSGTRATIFALASIFMTEAPQALEYAGTCRGAPASVTKIDGLDTAKASMTAEYTLPDAIVYCHLSEGRSGNSRISTTQIIASCADRFLRSKNGSSPLRAEANCRTGSISTSGPGWSNAYKMPLSPMCGDDNNQAISLFKVLCPSYEGKIEDE